MRVIARVIAKMDRVLIMLNAKVELRRFEGPHRPDIGPRFAQRSTARQGFLFRDFLHANLANKNISLKKLSNDCTNDNTCLLVHIHYSDNLSKYS